jgi:hypothetical protein
MIYLLGNTCLELEFLNLALCDILDDISPLERLNQLTEIYLTGSRVTDISPLSDMMNLFYLGVDSELDISPLDLDSAAHRSVLARLNIINYLRIIRSDAVNRSVHLYYFHKDDLVRDGVSPFSSEFRLLRPVSVLFTTKTPYSKSFSSNKHQQINQHPLKITTSSSPSPSWPSTVSHWQLQHN